MKKFLLWIAKLLRIDLVEKVEVAKVVEKFVVKNVYDGDTVDGNLVVNGDLAVRGSLNVSGGVIAEYITATGGSEKKVIIKSKEI